MVSAASKAKIEQYAVIGLFVVFGVVLLNALSRSGLISRRAGPAPTSAARTAESLLPDLMKKHWEIMDPKIMQVEEARPGQAAPIRAYTAQDLRDPFKELLPPPPAQAAAAPMASQAVPVASAARPAPLPLPTLLLSGIWWSVQPRALINGEVYGIGDHVQGATVKRISPEGVTVEFNGREILLQTSNVSAGGKRPRVANWGR